MAQDGCSADFTCQGQKDHQVVGLNSPLPVTSLWPAGLSTGKPPANRSPRLGGVLPPREFADPPPSLVVPLEPFREEASRWGLLSRAEQPGLSPGRDPTAPRGAFLASHLQPFPPSGHLSQTPLPGYPADSWCSHLSTTLSGFTQELTMGSRAPWKMTQTKGPKCCHSTDARRGTGSTFQMWAPKRCRRSASPIFNSTAVGGPDRENPWI